MKKVYLIHLEGQGDIDEKFVTEEAWNWVTSNDPGLPADHDGSTAWEDQLIPEPVKEIIRADHVKWNCDADAEESFNITSGSWENDRALMCPPDAGVDMDALDWGALRDSLAAQGFEYTGETYDGCIY